MKTVYSLKPTEDLFIDGSINKQYILRVRDLPSNQKPREKLSQSGASNLSSAELLAIIFEKGTKKEGVLSMANRVIKEYGENALMKSVNVADVVSNLSLPKNKSMQLIAVAELGRRFFGNTKGKRVVLRTPKQVFEYLKDMRDLSKEHVRGLYLNAHYELIYDETITIGVVDANIIHPREVFNPAIQHGAVAVIIAHNHPSGKVNPSKADREVTKQLVEAGKILGISVLDHVIIASKGFTSLISN